MFKIQKKIIVRLKTIGWLMYYIEYRQKFTIGKNHLILACGIW